MELLQNIRVVLVEPQGPLNVGSVARAMANFGLSDLVLVKGVSPQHPQAKEMASGAQELLASTSVVPDLAAALAPCSFVLATTGKPRERQPTLQPEEAAARILAEAELGRVALVFGREDHGLTSAELREAHVVCAIPTAPECRSLNLSQAVLLLAWEIFSLARSSGRTQRHQVSNSDTGRCISHELRLRLRDEMLAALRELTILNDGNEIPVSRSVERILALGPLQTRDARLLFTLARHISGNESSGTGTPLPEDGDDAQ